MRIDDMWIAGTGGVVGDLTSIEQAVEDGKYDSAAAESTAMVSYSVSEAAPPEMAVTAGRQAIEHAAGLDVEAGPETLFLHSHTHFQGLDLWPAECWIAGELLGEQLTDIPMTVDAASNGSLASLRIGASMLAADPSASTALITVADRFGPPVDRWKLSPGMVFGDGGAAAMLAKGNGRMRLDSMAFETDTSLEGLSRGDDAFREAPAAEVDTARRSREFLARGELSLRDVRDRSAEGVRRVVQRAVDDADSDIDDMDWVIPPFVGKSLLADSFIGPLDVDEERTLAPLGWTVGHLGPTDHLYALSHLMTNDLLDEGDRLLLIGTGMGFSFSAAVLTAGAIH